MTSAASLRPYSAPEHQSFLWTGSRNVALLVHGFPGTAAELRRVGTIIHDAGWSVRGMLLPGFGPEIEHLGDQTAEGWLRAVLAELNALRDEYDRVLLVGNSMGAALALQGAARVPVEGLLLFSPWWRINSRVLDLVAPLIPRIVGEIRPFQRARFSDPRTAEMVHRVVPEADLSDPQVHEALRAFGLRTHVFAELRTVGHMGFAALPEVSAPTLVIHASNDPLAHPTLTAEIARRLPNLRGVALLDANHELAHLLRPQEQAIAPLLTAFCDEIATVRPAGRAAPLPTALLQSPLA